MVDCFNKKYSIGEKIVLGIAAVAAFLMATSASAFVRYSPVASISAGDITTTQILDGTIKLQDLATTTSRWNWPQLGVGTTTEWATFSVEQGSTSPVFVVSDEGTSTPELIVTGKGYIGINTATPTTQMEITNDNSVSYLLEIGWTGIANGLLMNWRTIAFPSDGSASISFAGPGIISTGSTGNLTLTAGSSANTLIDGLGKTGIGTSTPASKLSVQGSAYIGSNLFLGGTLTSTSSVASTFPYASTTALTVSGMASTTNLTVSGVCTGCIKTYATSSASAVSAASAGATVTTTAYCLSGDVAIAGGFTESTAGSEHQTNFNPTTYQTTNDAWTMTAMTETTNALTITTTAICLDI